MKGPLWALLAFALGTGVGAGPAFLAPLVPGLDDAADDEPLSGASLLRATDPPTIDRPTWAVGDTWLVAFDGGDPLCRAVIVSVGEDGYRQGFWCDPEAQGLTELVATQVSVFDNGFLGAFTPELAGRFDEADGGGAFAWYDWPLADGKTWRTQIRDFPVDVVAHWDAEEGRYVMVGTAGGEPWAEWDYVPALRWWSTLEYAGGYTLEVLERSTRWDREVVYADSERRFRDAQQTLAAYGVPQTFVAEDEDEVLYVYMTRSGTYFERVEIRTPGGATVYQGNAFSEEGFRHTFLDAEPGTWTILRTGVATGSSAINVHGVHFTRILPQTLR